MFDEAFPSCRFYVEISGNMDAVFTEVNGLQIDIETQDVADGGNNSFVRKLPRGARIGNITLKRGMTKTHSLFRWACEVALGQITRADVAIVMYTSGSWPLIRWDFLGAYPVRYIGSTLSASTSQSAIETLELAHNGMLLMTSLAEVMASQAAGFASGQVAGAIAAPTADPQKALQQSSEPHTMRGPTEREKLDAELKTHGL